MKLQNHPVRNFAPGSAERNAIKSEIERQRASSLDVGPIVGGEERMRGDGIAMREPHSHDRVLGRYHPASATDARDAVAAAMSARPAWAATTLGDRMKIFMRAADLLAGPFNSRLVAATMLCQSKTAYQAEIDASCELIDFIRLNAAFAEDISRWQPASTADEDNRMDYRPLDGFVFAASPFNFTAIAGNLVLAPALMGNPVVWLPSERSVHSSAILMQLFREAGVPPGVINFLPTDRPAEVAREILGDENLAGVHFTGSTGTFDSIWRAIGGNISHYRSYPRIVGETGGKDFVLAHPSADVVALVTGLVRGAFDYQGQKCSAASRAYIPRSIWPQVRDELVSTADSLGIGEVSDLANFMGAVIDERSYRNIVEKLSVADTPGHEILTSRGPDDSEGWFVPPTIVECTDPLSPLMREEIFGPVLAVYVYPDEKIEETVDLVDRSTAYALTGAIFAEDRAAIDDLSDRLRDAAGNFYVNDKPTGAIVGRQPFGGGRRSGTNDKAGSPYNLLRWTSPRTVKTNLDRVRDHRYEHMAAS